MLSHLNELIWSAIAAAIAWWIYHYTQQPFLSLLFLLVLCAVYLWIRAKADARRERRHPD